MKIIAAVKSYFQNAKTFRNIIKDWFGEGAAPVSRQQAQERADKCFQCPFNHHEGNTGKELLPSIVIRRVEAKNKMKLFVENEWKISTCKLCGCYLPLKIHVPIIHIRQYTPQSIIDGISERKPDCWQVSESV